MGFSHHYDLVKEVDESKEEPQQTSIYDAKDEPRRSSTPVVTSWWKLLLCNFVAAVAGAGLMFFIAGRSFAPQPSSSEAISVTTSVAASSTKSAPTSPATSAISLAALNIPSSAIEVVEGSLDEIDSQNPLAHVILDCGHSPEEARAKGCVYDVMMQDWVPEPCYDAPLTEKYLAEGNWTWYGDGEGKTIISDEQMAKGEHGVAWMAVSYHKAHCVFSWMKIIRALRNKRGISQELLSYDHVMHCAHGALRQDSEDESLGVQAPTNYAKCALYGTWAIDFIPDAHDSSER